MFPDFKGLDFKSPLYLSKIITVLLLKRLFFKYSLYTSKIYASPWTLVHTGSERASSYIKIEALLLKNEQEVAVMAEVQGCGCLHIFA